MNQTDGWFDDDVGRRVSVDELRRVIRYVSGESSAIVDLVGNWPTVVGEQLAAHTRVRRISGDTLLVVADSTAAAAALRLREATVRNACRDSFSLVITHVHVRVDVRDASAGG